MMEIFGPQPAIFKNRNILSPNYIPENIVHREKELKEIARYFRYALDGATPPHLLLFGSTGTGKTVTLRRVIEELKRKTNEVLIGYTVGCESAYHVLVTIARDSGMYDMPLRGISLPEAWKRMEGFIENKLAIFIVDEMDKMMEKGGTELLYYWSRKPQICIVGITNKISTLELIEDMRVKSSYMPKKIVFPAYNAEEIKDILSDRKEAFQPGVLQPGVISRAAAYAAKRNGDARYALDLIAFAGDIAVREGASKVSIQHVDMAKGEVEIEFIRKSIAQLRETQKLLLYCIVFREHSSPTEIYKLYDHLAIKLHADRLSQRRLSDYVRELAFYGFVEVDKIGRGKGMGVTWKLRIPDMIDKHMLINELQVDPLLQNIKTASKYTTIDNFVTER